MTRVKERSLKAPDAEDCSTVLGRGVSLQLGAEILFCGLICVVPSLGVMNIYCSSALSYRSLVASLEGPEDSALLGIKDLNMVSRLLCVCTLALECAYVHKKE